MIRFPISVEIDITGRCNYHCLYCRNGHMRCAGDLDIDILMRLLNECEEHKVFSISISGGEPTLHNRFFDIVSKLGDMDVRWSLTTNGSNLDVRTVKHLSSNYVQNVFITLSGFSDETDNWHKGLKDCFQRTIHAIEVCLDNSVPITLGFLLTPINHSEVIPFIEFCKSRGIAAKLMRVEPLGEALRHFNSLCISPEDYSSAKKLFIDELGAKAILGESDVAFEERFCSAGVISCVIGFDGNVYPCVNFLGSEEMICGSIKNNLLSEIWNNSQLLQSFREPRVYADYCDLCSKRIICRGGCRAEAYRKTGDYRAIEFPCSICIDLNIPHKSE